MKMLAKSTTVTVLSFGFLPLVFFAFYIVSLFIPNLSIFVFIVSIPIGFIAAALFRRQVAAFWALTAGAASLSIMTTVLIVLVLFIGSLSSYEPSSLPFFMAYFFTFISLTTMLFIVHKISFDSD